MIHLPEAFVQRMERQLGAEMPLFLQAMDEPAARGVRMNPFKQMFNGHETYERGCPVPWCENGYLLPSGSRAGMTVFHEAGAFYLQEPSAMLPAEVLDAKPGEVILDLCAAPGGKSTQIGLKMKGQGVLICNEPVLSRAQILSRNLERIGIPNAVAVCALPEMLSSRWNGVFDAVLADVPCSGEGMFRRDPETCSEWSPDQAAGCAGRQRGILQEAAKMLRPGGRLIYSTCTFHPAENEENIAWFLDSHKDFEPEGFRLPGIDGRNGTWTCYPHRNAGEGQFVAKLRKKGDEDPAALSACTSAPDRTILKAYRATFPCFPEPNGMIGNRIMRIPASPDLKGLQILRAGLHLAEIRGKTLIPDHAAALSVQPVPAPALELDDATTVRFYAGEELRGDCAGWILMKYCGLNLGWGKGSNGSVKNHYPKGLRKSNILLSETGAR